MKANLFSLFFGLLGMAAQAVGQREDLRQPGGHHPHRNAREHQNGGHLHDQDYGQPVRRQHRPHQALSGAMTPLTPAGYDENESAGYTHHDRRAPYRTV